MFLLATNFPSAAPKCSQKCGRFNQNGRTISGWVDQDCFVTNEMSMGAAENPWPLERPE